MNRGTGGTRTEPAQGGIAHRRSIRPSCAIYSLFRRENMLYSGEVCSMPVRVTKRIPVRSGLAAEQIQIFLINGSVNPRKAQQGVEQHIVGNRLIPQGLRMFKLAGKQRILPD